MKTKATGFIALTLLFWGMANGVSALDLSDVLPELRTLPAPLSITEGLRLNYYVAVATIAEKDVLKWVDNAGTTNTAEVPTPSGHGVTQVDVVGVTPQWAALRVQPWLYHNFDGPLVPMLGSDEGLVCYAAGGDWWVHPAALAAVTPLLRDDLKILRMPITIGGRTYDALRIQAEDASSRQVLSYDLATGYLIYKGSAVTGNEATTLSQAFFIGARALNLPWRGGRLPAWVAANQHLVYEGTYSAVTWGNEPLVLALHSDLKISAVDDDWFVYDQTLTRSSLPGMPPAVDKRTLASGVNHLLGVCLPPSALAQLQAGQHLDTDDVTAASVDVRFVGTLPNGRPGVVLRLRAGEAAWVDTAYDRVTGVAVSQQTYDGPGYPLYYFQSEVTLREIPPDLPATPRLSIARNPATGGLKIACPTEPGRVLTLLQSTDQCRSWGVVPGYDEVPCTGAPFAYEFKPGLTPTFYVVKMR